VVVFIIYCDSFSYGNFCHQSRQHIRLGTNFCEWTCQIERDQYIEDSLKQNLHQLVSETESEKRNILSVLGGDLSPVSNFKKEDMPTVPRNHTQRSSLVSNWTIAYNKLTDIALYRQFGTTYYAEQNDLHVNWDNNEAKTLLCIMKHQASNFGHSIPNYICNKRITLSRHPINKAEFAKWMYVILEDNKKDFCEIHKLVLPHDSHLISRC
ncbi:Hypothetical predicted protein, partial [Mytilus galloprovincialis]